MPFKCLPHAVRHAQDLRKKSTSAEVILWDALRNRKFRGLKFRRQVPIGKFIVDFLCLNPPLIIELDGPIHDFRMQEDAERTEGIIEDYNFPILRMKNKEITENLPNALQKIEQQLIVDSPPHSVRPRRTPLSHGERGTEGIHTANFVLIKTELPSPSGRRVGDEAGKKSHS